MKLSAACAFVVGTVALDISTISATPYVQNYGSTIETAAVSAVEKSIKKAKNNGLPSKPPASSSSALGIQDGRVCSIEKTAEGTYTLRATLGNETVLFLERPDREAATVSTQTFVDNFDKAFASSFPNVAITFTSNPEPSSSSSSASVDGPLIAILSRPRIIGGLDDGSSTLEVEYLMEQSESQRTVATIDQFLDASGPCSIFIDNLPIGTVIPLINVPWPNRIL